MRQPHDGQRVNFVSSFAISFLHFLFEHTYMLAPLASFSLPLLPAYLFLYSPSILVLTSPEGVEREYAPPANFVPQDLHAQSELEERRTESFPHFGQA